MPAFLPPCYQEWLHYFEFIVFFFDPLLLVIVLFQPFIFQHYSYHQLFFFASFLLLQLHYSSTMQPLQLFSPPFSNVMKNFSVSLSKLIHYFYYVLLFWFQKFAKVQCLFFYLLQQLILSFSYVRFLHLTISKIIKLLYKVDLQFLCIRECLLLFPFSIFVLITNLSSVMIID